jgi:uncharacterized membrane protein YsdA (DUF1294 family)/cold shock CspA family protein
MRFEGTLKTWNDDRGFGFLQSAQGGDDIFVHVKAFSPRGGRPQAGQLVSFEIELGPQGKKRAKNVAPLRAPRVRRPDPAGSRVQWGTATLFAIPAFLVLYLVLGIVWKPPLWIAGIYVMASIITFAAYMGDKSAAREGGWRTPEKTLHVLALAGGWPGALLAQQFLRHKSAKAGFRAAFWATVTLNVTALVLLCSPLGRAFLPLT